MSLGTVLFLLTTSAFALPQDSPALNQLQTVAAGGPQAFHKAADNCAPVVCKQDSGVAVPTHARRRYAAGFVHSEPKVPLAAAPSNVNTITINNIGHEKGGECGGGSHRLLGAGLGAALGYLVALALPSCFPPFGVIALVALGGLIGAAAFSK